MRAPIAALLLAAVVAGGAASWPSTVVGAEGARAADEPAANAVAEGRQGDNPRNAADAEKQPAGEGEEGGGEHTPAINPKNLALQLFNFAVLLFILIKFGGGAINKALLARHQQLKTDLAAASEQRAAAEQRLRKQDARLASLESEIAAIRAGIKQEAEAEKARLIQAAEERARRIREETAFMLDQQVKEAEAQLRREVAEAAVKIAEELVRRTLDGRDQQRLIETFVSEVATGNGTNGSSTHRSDGAPPARPAPRSEV